MARSQKPPPPPDLDEQIRAGRQRSRLTEASPDFVQAPADFLGVLLGTEFTQRLREARTIVETKGLEVGFTLSLRLSAQPAAWTKATWGKVVTGSTEEIRESHDPGHDYYTQLAGRLPLLLLHFHPSEKLGLSRADCLMASQVIRESKSLLEKTPAVYRPIFGVATLSAKNETEVLLVQRKTPGTFMEFSEIAQGYDTQAWLAAPLFNVAHIRFSDGGVGFALLADTGLAAPLT